MFVTIICEEYPFTLLRKKYTVTSRLFTHIVSTEKMHSDLRDRKDPRVTKNTYNNSCF